MLLMPSQFILRLQTDCELIATQAANASALLHMVCVRSRILQVIKIHAFNDTFVSPKSFQFKSCVRYDDRQSDVSMSKTTTGPIAICTSLQTYEMYSQSAIDQ
jgi:hypothetical protein